MENKILIYNQVLKPQQLTTNHLLSRVLGIIINGAQFFRNRDIQKNHHPSQRRDKKR